MEIPMSKTFWWILGGILIVLIALTAILLVQGEKTAEGVATGAVATALAGVAALEAARRKREAARQAAEIAQKETASDRKIIADGVLKAEEEMANQPGKVSGMTTDQKVSEGNRLFGNDHSSEVNQ